MTPRIRAALAATALTALAACTPPGTGPDPSAAATSAAPAATLDSRPLDQQLADGIHAGDHALVELALGAVAELFTTVPYLLAPLHWATYAGNLDTMQALLDWGVSPDLSGPATGATPLMIAAYQNDAEAAEVLIVAGASIELRDFEGSSALDVARSVGAVDVEALLVGYGAE